ncbi:hypothetical protein FB382_004391 [Nocardioides ginsengisegetis]|uniref:Uncharacterized protein n=1 Tax=Nocardioides ginsengisegetis TaxID=661491 RepID=A0A7W3PBN4_9ACTN|nr:DUF6093 family protein [Nocardioides ginsengisegetis]MBA8806040.1 hypothetical protein [Nocardioides ginsengisegetis]
MSAASVAAHGRRAAEALMLDTFTAYGAPEWATVDGLEQETRVAQYDTRGKVSGPSMQSRDTNTRLVSVGGVERPVVEGGLHIPLAAALPAVGWELECIAVGPASDPSLLGRRWRVVDVPAKSYATARRLDVVEVTS